MIEFIRQLFGNRFGVARSPQWEQVRKDFLKAHPLCAVCGRKGSLLKPNEVHHIKPFHLHPELELDPNNLITLERDFHLLFGHLMDWKSYNPDVVKDAEEWNLKISNRLK